MSISVRWIIQLLIMNYKNAGCLFLLTVGILGCTGITDELQTDSLLTSGTFIDSRDNHEYKWITIGNQTWMAENLAYLPAINNAVTDTANLPNFYVYEYKGTDVHEAKATINYATYGVLYDWSAALISCPAGWHLPSDEEWKQLEFNLGMSDSQTDECLTSFFRGTNQGIQMKNKSGWHNNGNGTNVYGFSGLPAGFYFSTGNFHFIGSISYWWSSSTTDSLATFAWARGLGYYADGVCRNRNFKENGFSVRCIKD